MNEEEKIKLFKVIWALGNSIEDLCKAQDLLPISGEYFEMRKKIITLSNQIIDLRNELKTDAGLP